MREDATFLGTVVSVAGAKVHVAISVDVPSTSPIVRGRIYRLGQIGSFVRLPLGFLNVYGVVASVGAAPGTAGDESGLAWPASQRTLEVQLVGEAIGSGPFMRGVSEYPTLDDEVHVVTEDDLARIYGSEGATAPVVVGTHSASESLPAIIDLDRLVTRHCAILGSTGSGKSNTVAALLKSVTSGDYPSANVIVIDPHGEYGSAFEGISRVFRIGDSTFPLLLPYWALSFDELAWFLVDRRSASEASQDTKLRDMIYEMRRSAAPGCKANPTANPLGADEVTADSPVPFDAKRLWYQLDRDERKTWKDVPRTVEALVSEGNAETLTSAQFTPAGAGNTSPFKNMPVPPMGAYANRIYARLRDRRFGFMLSPGEYDGVAKDLNELVSSWVDHDRAITVLDLAGVPPEVTDLVVGLLTRILFETMFWGRAQAGIGRQRPLLMVYEEAHSYLPRSEGQFIQGYARRAVQRVLKEGRKYGVGAVVVSQRPSELDETILSQCGTFIALRLSNSQDQSRVSAMIPDEIAGLVNLLPSLRTGEAVIVGEAMAIPSRVRIDPVSPRPDSGDPNVAERWASAREPAADFAKAITAWRRQERPT